MGVLHVERELLFPPGVIPLLREARGDDWRRLVDHVASLPQDESPGLAFSLMMIRLNGCLICETDSYRATRGCAACSLISLRRHRGSDADMLKKYERALRDVDAYLGVRGSRTRPGERRLTVETA